MERPQILCFVRQSILSINQDLGPDDVKESSSLTQDLSFDSLRIESLIASLKEGLGSLEFTPWYVRASRRGQDTIGSLIDFIQERQ